MNINHKEVPVETLIELVTSIKVQMDIPVQVENNIEVPVEPQLEDQLEDQVEVPIKEEFNKLFIVNNNKEYDDKVSTITTSEDENIINDKVKQILKNNITKSQLEENNINFGTNIDRLNIKQQIIVNQTKPNIINRNQSIHASKIFRKR